MCAGVPCDLLLGFHDLLIRPKLLNSKVSVKHPKPPSPLGERGLGALLGLGLALEPQPGLGLAEGPWSSLCCAGAQMSLEVCSSWGCCGLVLPSPEPLSPGSVCATSRCAERCVSAISGAPLLIFVSF